MQGVLLPGDRRVEIRDFPEPVPGHGQVVVQMQASTICGSDIRAIYREHLGVGPERYRGVIAGHEPSGHVVEVGPGVKRLQPGDRVAIYHIAGCGVCDECRAGYMIGCHNEHRAAYGWQRDGGHAQYLLADEVTCLPLPDELSYVDGASSACSFGTAYEALLRLDVSGRDRLLVTGLGPVGLAAAMLGRAMGATTIIGTDASPARLRLAEESRLVDHVVPADESTLGAVLDLTGGKGCEASIDCSGAAPARLLALQGTRDWGRCAFVGEGGTVSFEPSPVLIHKQLTLYGSWVTSLAHMEELLDRLVRWRIHPHDVVTDRFALDQAADAYRVADEGQSGKVAIVFE